MNKLLIICGPTATGKTGLGIRLAKKFAGEIISADSRQVYIGMDIGTGKDLPVNAKFKIKNEKLQLKIKNGQNLKLYRFEDIPVWLLDIVRPNQEFSVADFVNLADITIGDVHRRNKLPVVVGGTGFYIKALVDGIETLGMPPDWELRRSLQNKSVEELFEMLARLDSARTASLNYSDKQNPRRLIRAIEVAIYQKSTHSTSSGLILSKVEVSKINPFDKLRVDTEQGRSIKNQNDKLKIKNRLDVLFVGLTAPYKKLYEKVDQRIDEQVETGAEKEVGQLLEQGYTWDLPAMTAMGYGVWRPYFERRASKDEVIQRWKFEEHAYIRRQMTWFKKNKRINWFNITKEEWICAVEKIVKNWYNRRI